MRIVSIETSCDETAIAVIEAAGHPQKNGVHFSVLSNVVLSQMKLHAKYGGVYPSLAKREHAKNLIPVLKQALQESNFLRVKQNLKPIPYNLKPILEREPELLKQFLDFIPRIEKPPIDAIAVTYGPGLEPALWVGINLAKALALVWNIPVIPVNHMEGHIVSALLKQSPNHAEQTRKIAENSRPSAKGGSASGGKTYNLKPTTFPVLALLISGGHTELVLSKKWLEYRLIGETRDDAAGEAFDKVARMLGLGYPGGPAISALAQKVRKSKVEGQTSHIALPRPMIDSGDFDFSFSGLKTAVLYELKKRKKNTQLIRDFAYEFEEAVTDVIVKKTIGAAEASRAATIVVGGGVSANERIRERLTEAILKKLPNTALSIPSHELTTDNALMIAVAGYIRATTKRASVIPARKANTIKAEGTLRLV